MDHWRRLISVDPRLVAPVCAGAIEYEAQTGSLVRVTCGIRSYREQQALFAAGKTKTMHSYHLKGLAVDLAIIRDGEALWDFDLYRVLNHYIQDAADAFDVSITWGGHWTPLRDAVHWQLEAVPLYTA